ncbi:MAG: Ig-like domain-containing protein [bacterium]
MLKKIFVFCVVVFFALFFFSAADVNVARAAFGNFILSGGSQLTDNFCVDDDIYVYLNGNLIYSDIDPHWASCNNQPVNFQASVGDVLMVSAIDSKGGCRGIGPLWLHYGDESVKLDDGQEDGCEGWPAGTVFYNKTFNIPAVASNPIIIVPGIMGSWYSDGEWKLDPILDTYDNLWDAFLQAGYEENKTLFAFPYQWRNSNVVTAQFLKQKIDEVKTISGSDKVDIVAHSMGGLVTRYYVVSDYYDHDVDKIVFLGTPHKGVPKSYLRWEGATGFESYQEKIAKIYFISEAHLFGYDSLFSYIQDRVKSVEELLPDYIYLQDMDSISLRPYDKINYPDNYPYNDFLEYLNSEEKINQFLNSGISALNITGYTGDNTINVIKVSSGEDYSPMWEHGYREETINLAGDGTVPNISSLPFPVSVINDASHDSFPTEAQKQVISYLTGTMPIYEINNTPEPEEILVISIHSPADFVITSPSGQKLGKDFTNNVNINEIEHSFYTGFINEPEFAVIINPEQGEYKIELQGTDNGEYAVEVDYISEEKEITKDFTGNINLNENHAFDFNYNNENEENPIGDLEPEDEIPPVIAINNPIEGEKYLHSENLTIDYSATDDFSGIENIYIYLDGNILSTTTVDLFYQRLGAHVLKITAVDMAGNETIKEIDFMIISSIDSAIDDVKRCYGENIIKRERIKNTLIKDLEWVKEYIEKHQDNPNAEILKKIIKTKYEVMIKLINIYEKQDWIIKYGGDIIKQDINYLKNNL